MTALGRLADRSATQEHGHRGQVAPDRAYSGSQCATPAAKVIGPVIQSAPKKPFAVSVCDDPDMAATDIDGYLRALDEPKRGTLEEMRRRILEIVPKSEQCLSYSVPAFKVQGKTVAGLAAFKNHLSYL